MDANIGWYALFLAIMNPHYDATNACLYFRLTNEDFREAFKNRRPIDGLPRKGRRPKYPSQTIKSSLYK